MHSIHFLNSANSDPLAGPGQSAGFWRVQASGATTDLIFVFAPLQAPARAKSGESQTKIMQKSDENQAKGFWTVGRKSDENQTGIC